MSWWRVPTDTDWTNFTTYVNGYQSAAPDYDYRYNNETGKIAKSLANTSGWDADATAGNVGNDQTSNNATGFMALPGGWRAPDTGLFYDLGSHVAFWSSSFSGSNAWRYGLSSDIATVLRHSLEQGRGYYIRLVRDDTGSDADGTIYTDDYTGNDGTKYDSVKIGDHIWLAENLKETKYADGTTIPRITVNADWTADTTGARCEYNNDASSESDTYGYLYNFYAVTNAKGLVRPGFYRVKDGNWDLADSWATTSGGTTYHAAPPTSSDDVFFDASTPTGTHTVNVTANTLALNFTGFTGTFAGSSVLNVYGSLTLGSGMTRTYTGQLTFLGTAAASLTSNGKSLDRMVINNASKVLTLQDKLTLTRSATVTAVIQLSDGSFVHNNQDVECTGSINFINGAFTFYNLIKNGTAGVLDRMIFSYNITVTGTLTLKGNAANQRILVNSSVTGTQRTITAAALDLANLDFQDIKGAGAASWDLSAITGLSGDCGGNSDITFTTGITCYYVGGAAHGNWSDTTKWMTTSGGSTAARVPLPQDSAVIDVNSFSGYRSLTQDMSRISSTNFTGSVDVTWTTNTVASVFGSINLTNLNTLAPDTSAYTFGGRGAYTLTSAGKTWAKPITLDAPGGSLTLGDKLTATGNYAFTITRGSFNANNYDVEVDRVASNNANTRSISMGSGLWTLTGGANTPWSSNTITNLTFNAGTSTIKLTGAFTSSTRYFSAGGLTFNNFWNATTGEHFFTIADANFNDLKIDAGRRQRFYRGTTTTINTLTALGTSESPIIIDTDSTAAILTKAGGGVIEGVDYLNVSYITGNPDNTWYVGANSVDSGNNTRIYFTDPPQTANSERGLYISGKDTGTSERSLYIQGQDSATSERSLYIQGSISTNSERGLWTSGADTGTSERNLWVQGQLTDDSERGLYITGSIDETSERGLYLSGIATDTSERGLYTQGQLTSDSERGLYLEGVDTATSERGLYTSGVDTATSERGLYISGADTGSSERGLYLEGKAETTYTREVDAALDTNDTDLSTSFTAQDYLDVATEDSVFVTLQGQSGYFKFLFKELNEGGAAQSFTVTWKGKVGVGGNVYLQAYNRISDEWVQLDTLVATDGQAFTLSGSVSTGFADYYDSNYIISCRVYK